MRKKDILYFFLMVILGLNSCMQDEVLVERNDNYGLTAEIPSYQYESETRVSFSRDLSVFNWSDGDQIGLYYKSGTSSANAVFKIDKGGSNSGLFTNDAFILKPNSTYYAFYPYNHEATIDSYPLDFTGQVQTANKSTAHIGSRNYMRAQVKTDANGGANIAFQNQAAVIQMVLPVEETGIYTSLTLSSSADDFIAKATLDMSTGTITPTTKNHEVKLSFGKGISVNKGDVLTAYLLVAPTDLGGKYLTVTLKEKDGAIVTVGTGVGKKMEKGKAYRFEGGNLNEIPYLTFTAAEQQTIIISGPADILQLLEFSINNGPWHDCYTYRLATKNFGGNEGAFRLRGKSEYGTALSTTFSLSTISFSKKDVEVECYGDLRTLVDYENYKTADTSNAMFCRLFSNATNLTHAPSLPATTLAPNCYLGMFSRCALLTQAPELPASTLASNCYDSMFSGCAGLTQTPEISASTLAPYCCASMFSGCTGLTQISELPATTLAPNCYDSMFSGCTALLNVPELPATKLADNCYYYMFGGCTSLIQAPKLPATTLAMSCYEYMFQDCTNLTYAPELPATNLTHKCYSHMFQGCTSLIRAPELLATTLASQCYSSMFSGCSNLNYVKMMALDVSADKCVSNILPIWGPSTPGTLVLNAAATWDMYQQGMGLPDGWTVIRATE